MDLRWFSSFTPQFATAKQGQRVQQIRPASRKKTDAKFEGDTTYGQDFRKWPGDKRSLIKNDGEYQPSSAPFEGLDLPAIAFEALRMHRVTQLAERDSSPDWRVPPR